MAPRIVNARDIRNNWGINGITFDTDGANAMLQINCRWVRDDLLKHQDNGTSVGALTTAMQNISGYFDPNPKYQGIVDDMTSAGNVESWTTQMGYLNNALKITTPNGNKLYACIEGPNEIGDPNNGAYFPDTYPGGIGTPFFAASGQSDAHDATNRKYFGVWAKYVSDYRSANTALWIGIELISPTILDVGNGGNPGNTIRSPSGLPGDYTGAAYPDGAGLGIVGLVDYGTIHYYPSSTNKAETTPCGPDNDNNPSSNNQLNYDQWYKGFADGMSGGGGGAGMSMVCSELNTNGTWSADGTGSAWCNAAALLDTFALGGHRMIFYDAVPDNRGYGFWSTYPTVLTRRGILMANISDLVSLNNNYKDTLNLTSNDTLFSPPSFTQGYTGTPTVTDNTGNAKFGAAGNCLVMPKSDGSTMIVVWRESPYDNGDGSNTVDGTNALPPTCSITVNFGSSQTYNIWDPTGSGTGGNAGNTRTIVKGATKVAGPVTASSATFNVYGAPVFIELVAVPVTAAPAAPTNFALGTPTSTRDTATWTASTGQPASYTMEYQQGTNTGAWTAQATINSSNTSYTYYGLTPNTQYYFRMHATNVKGDSPPTGSQTITTKVTAPTTTPAVVGTNFAKSRDDGDNVTSKTLSLPSVPQASSSVFVFMNGYAGTGSNSSNVTPPTGATVVSGPNYDGGAEVTWCWKLTNNVTSNLFTFSNFDSANNTGWKIIEVSNAVTHEATNGSVTSSSTTNVTWPLTTPNPTNAIGLTLLSLTQPITSTGATSTGTTMKLVDTGAAFHVGVLLQETNAATTPATLALSGGTANDTDAYLNVNIYGASVPSQVTGAKASNTEANTTGLAWNAVKGATSYQVDVSTNSGTSWNTQAVLAPTSTGYTVSSLSPSTSYQFRVSASSDSGIGQPSAAVLVTTLAQNSLELLQSAIGVDHAVGQTGTVTATLTNAATVGNTLVFYFTTRNTNTGLTPPTGAKNIVSLSADTNPHCMQMMWTMDVTSANAVKAFSYTGYIDGACLCVAEVQGVTVVDTPTHSGSISFTDNVSVTLPVTGPSATPAIGIYGINMPNGPDSWGTMPNGFTLLQAGLGNEAASDFEYRQAAFFQVASGGTTGNVTIPFALPTGVVQEGNPEFAGMNLLGTTQLVKPGPCTLTFGTATTTSQPLTINPATGTVTRYVIQYSINANMTSSTPITVSTGLTATASPLNAGTTYYYTVQAFNDTAQGDISAIVHNATATGANSKYVEIGGKLFLLDGKIAKF